MKYQQDQMLHPTYPVFYPSGAKLFSCLLCVTLVVLVILYTLRTMTDIDSWWHLAEGRYIVQERIIPESNIFRFTTPAEKTLNHEWLSQVLFYTLYRVGGIPALQFFFIALMVATFLLLLFLYLDREWYLTAPSILFLALLASSERFAIRPHLLTFFLATLFLFILIRYKEQRGRNLLWLLPFLQILWVNLHGGFIIGLILLGAFVVGEGIEKWVGSRDVGPVIRGNRYQHLVLVSFSALVLCVVNPHSFSLFTRLYRELGNEVFKAGFLEWNAPFALQVPFFPDVIYQYKIFLVLSLASFLLNIRRCRLTDLCLYIPLFALSLFSFRFIALFVLLTAPSVICNINTVLQTFTIRFKETRERNFFRLQIGAALLLLFFIFVAAWDVVSDNYYIRNRSLARFGIGISDLAFSSEAVHFLQTLNPPAQLFHTLDLGGYVLWHLYPQKVFIDTISVDPSFFQEYSMVMTYPQLWEIYSQKYKINTVLLTHFWPQAKGLLSFLAQHPEWTLIYFDDRAAVFLRNTPQTLPLLERFAVDVPTRASALLSQNYTALLAKPGSLFLKVAYPLPLLRLGDFFRALGALEQARTAYHLALTIDPALPVAHFLLGQVYTEQHRIDQAIYHYQTTLHLSKQYPEALYALAELYRQRGLQGRALSAYTQFLAQERGAHALREDALAKITLLNEGY